MTIDPIVLAVALHQYLTQDPLEDSIGVTIAVSVADRAAFEAQSADLNGVPSGCRVLAEYDDGTAELWERSASDGFLPPVPVTQPGNIVRLVVANANISTGEMPYFRVVVADEDLATRLVGLPLSAEQRDAVSSLITEAVGTVTATLLQAVAAITIPAPVVPTKMATNEDVTTEATTDFVYCYSDDPVTVTLANDGLFNVAILNSGSSPVSVVNEDGVAIGTVDTGSGGRGGLFGHGPQVGSWGKVL